jgi:hypothetical protein
MLNWKSFKFKLFVYFLLIKMWLISIMKPITLKLKIILNLKPKSIKQPTKLTIESDSDSESETETESDSYYESETETETESESESESETRKKKYKKNRKH